MATGVFGYAAINARVRAMYSTLLSPQEWAELINAPDFNTLIGLLRRTVYGPYLVQVDESELNPRRAVYEIKRQMADTYTTVIKAAPEQTCPLLTQLYRGFEVDNLKAVLRGIQSGASWDQIRYVLFPMGPISTIPAQAMVESGSIPTAVELLRGTPYYPTLAHAMERFNAEQSLFPLEVALDLYYWREIWNEINKLAKTDREQAVRIIGMLLDVSNLMWAIRYRVYYNLSEEEVINYTLPIGYQVKDADIRAIAAGADIPQIVSRIYPKITEAANLLVDPKDGLPKLEILFQRYVMERSKEAFIGYPFQIGVPLAFLVLKDMEVQDLTVLIEAKASKMPAEEFQPYLVVGSAPK